jgi:hypothetical protein
MRSLKYWWGEMIRKQGYSRKAMASLAMLVSWDIWQERNALLFLNNISISNMIVSKINSDVVLWSTAGQKPWLL